MFSDSKMKGIIKTKVDGFTTFNDVVFSLSIEKDIIVWKIGTDKFQMVLLMNLKDLDFQLKRLLHFQKELKKEEE